MKTNTKLNSFDRTEHFPSIVRFHPTRKLRLAVGALSGDMAFFDLHTKRKLFNNSDLKYPISDICMPVNDPNIILSVGYDTFISVFDIREKRLTNRFKQNFGINTIASSDCGNYIATGDLRGSVYSYDTRFMDQPLIQKQVHDNKITRVTFVPKSSTSSDTFNSIGIESGSKNTSRYSRRISESFYANDVVENRRLSLLDGIADDLHQRRDFSPETRPSSNRMSTDSRFSLGGYRRRFDEFLNSSGEDSAAISEKRSLTSKDNIINIANRKSNANRLTITASHQSVTNEFAQSRAKQLKRDSILKPVYESVIEEKENNGSVKIPSSPISNVTFDEKHDSSTGILKSLHSNQNNSTPNYKVIPQNATKVTEDIDALNEKVEKLLNMNEKLVERLMAQEVLQKTECSNIKWQIERVHGHIYTFCFNKFFNQEDRLEEMKTSVEFLGNCLAEIVTDNKMLIEENRKLREELKNKSGK